MRIEFLLKKEHLPKEDRKAFAEEIGDPTNCSFLTSKKLGYLSINVKEQCAILTFPDTDRISSIQEFLSSNNIDQVHDIVMTENVYIDEKGIKPHRGIYKRGTSEAIVDSYIDKKGGMNSNSYPVWKLVLHGTNIESLYDLYRRIRRGEQQPDEWWDEKPTK